MNQSAPGALRADSRGSPSAHLASGSIGTAAGMVLAVRVLAAGAGLAYGVVVARMFGAALSGVLAIGITASLAAKLVGELGLATPMLRHAAAGIDAGRWDAVAGIYRRGVAMASAASIVVAVALIAAAPVLAGPVFSAPDLAPVLRILAVGVVPTVLLVIHAGMLRAVRRPVAAGMIESLGPYAVATAMLVVVGDRLGIAGAAWGLVAGSTAMLVTARITWRRVSAPVAAIVTPAGRTLLAAGLPVMVVMGTHLVIEWSDTIMLGILASSSDVGIYAAAGRTAALVAFVLHATNAVTAPYYAAFHARGDARSMRRLAVRSTLAMSAVALPIAFVLMVGSRRVLGVFGPEFVAGGAVLAILAAAQLANVAAGSVGTILTMTGHERPLRNVLVVVGAANIALNAVMIPFWGPEGAAAATAISLVAANGAALGLVQRRLGFSTLPGLARAHG